jgi:hypothetical protein
MLSIPLEGLVGPQRAVLPLLHSVLALCFGYRTSEFFSRAFVCLFIRISLFVIFHAAGNAFFMLPEDGDDRKQTVCL